MSRGRVPGWATRPIPTVPIVTTRAERTGPIGPPVRSMEAAAGVVQRYLKETGADIHGKEHFCTVMLDSDHRLIGVNEVAMGSISGVSVAMSEVFLAPLLCKATTLMFVHNHPSGCLRPSAPDLTFDAHLTLACKILGIRTLGSCIVTETGWKSFGGA